MYLKLDKLRSTITISISDLDSAMEIIDSKEETWENLKEFYEDFEIEYKLIVCKDNNFKVTALIYDKE